MVGFVACGEAPKERTGESGSSLNSSADGQIDRQEVLDRSQSWLGENVQYSQSDYHQNQFGNYRQDCSGFVSMAWHLGTSRTTWTLHDVSTPISPGDLQPGDALLLDNDNEDHVALFVGWAGPNKPIVREEYDYGHVAEERTWESLRGFGPVRYNNITGAAGAPNGASAPGAPPPAGGNTTCDGGNGTVVGRINDKYVALGGCGSFLGLPQSDEQGTPDGVGRYSVFDNGSIYWTPQLDAWEVHGMIRDKWGELNWEAGSLGYPTSDEYATDDGRRSDFERGAILWHASSDTFTVLGANGAPAQ
jgi:hypothetical protein